MMRALRSRDEMISVSNSPSHHSSDTEQQAGPDFGVYAHHEEYSWPHKLHIYIVRSLPGTDELRRPGRQVIGRFRATALLDVMKQ